MALDMVSHSVLTLSCINHKYILLYVLEDVVALVTNYILMQGKSKVFSS